MSDDASTDFGMGLVLDCRDPVALAPFWAEALHYVNLGAVENYVLLVPDGRPGPNLLLQQVPEDKIAKNRMHLDIHNANIAGEAARLEQLGARRLEDQVRSEHGSSWVMMADPEGNEFCVCDAGAC